MTEWENSNSKSVVNLNKRINQSSTNFKMSSNRFISLISLLDGLNIITLVDN